MAPGVYKTFVIEVVCTPLTCRDDMIHLYAFSRTKGNFAQSASVSLSLVQYQPLFPVGFPSYLSLFALYPVLAQSGIIGGVFPYDFREPGDRGCVGSSQFCLSFLEGPIAIVAVVARFYPCTTFVRVSAFCPVPEHLPLGMLNLVEDILGC